MGDTEIKNDLRKYSNKQKTRRPFWSIMLITVSLLHGVFILREPGYLGRHSQPPMTRNLELFIAIPLILLGVTKILSIVLNKKTLRNISIWGLSFFWTGLFLISFVYSFGIGNPNPAWYFYGFIMISCYKVSLSGGFH